MVILILGILGAFLTLSSALTLFLALRVIIWRVAYTAKGMGSSVPLDGKSRLMFLGWILGWIVALIAGLALLIWSLTS